MALGPVDVVIIGFPGNNFNGDIAPAIMELVDAGTIRADRFQAPEDAEVMAEAILALYDPAALGKVQAWF